MISQGVNTIGYRASKIIDFALPNADVAWRRGLASLRNHDLACEIELFATQLADLTSLAEVQRTSL
jgi:hypothetical protein